MPDRPFTLDEKRQWTKLFEWRDELAQSARQVEWELHNHRKRCRQYAIWARNNLPVKSRGMKSKLFRLPVLAVLLALALIAPAQPIPNAVVPPAPTSAVTITLIWDVPTDPSITGIEVYWGGQDGVYTNSAPAQFLNSATLTLPPAPKYYFAVRPISTCVGCVSEIPFPYRANTHLAPIVDGFSNQVMWQPTTNRQSTLKAQSSPTPAGPWETLFLVNPTNDVNFFRLVRTNAP